MKRSVLVITIIVILVLVLGNTLFYTKESPATPGHVHHMMVASEEQFIFEMVPHHQEAVDSSRIIALKTNNEELRALARAIIDAQEKEITMMNEWKESWYPASAYAVSYTPMMPSLDSLSAYDADRAFLEGMIMHHQMAVTMAYQVLTLHPREEVADFAHDIIDVQTQEIEQMRAILLELS